MDEKVLPIKIEREVEKNGVRKKREKSSKKWKVEEKGMKSEHKKCGEKVQESNIKSG